MELGFKVSCRWTWQAQFIEKNNDALHASLSALITESRNPLVKKIFEGDASVQQIGKLTFISIGSKFRSQLGVLMDKLNKTVRDASLTRTHLIPRLHDEAGSTSWLYERSSSQLVERSSCARRALVEPASSCKRGISKISK